MRRAGWHLLGTARMGNDPATIRRQRLGTQPRREEPLHRRRQPLRDGGGVNPTRTIQALALYVADNIKRRIENSVRLIFMADHPNPIATTIR